MGSNFLQCLKVCGFICGLSSALNIWFWLGMTVFSAMDNTYLKIEFEGYESATADNSRFTLIYGLLIILNILWCVGCFGCTQLACYKDKDEEEFAEDGEMKGTKIAFNEQRIGINDQFSEVSSNVNNSD